MSRKKTGVKFPLVACSNIRIPSGSVFCRLVILTQISTDMKPRDLLHVMAASHVPSNFMGPDCQNQLAIGEENCVLMSSDISLAETSKLTHKQVCCFCP